MKFIKWALFLWGLSFWPYLGVSEAWAQEPAKFGVSPWTSPRLLQAWAKPIEEALEAQTGIAYQMASSPNLQKYLLAAVEGQFEIVQTPMHLGLYLIRHHNFKGVMFARAKLMILLITRKNLSIDRLAQLKGKSMAVSGPVAIATLLAKEAMANELFHSKLVSQRNHWQAVEALQKKRVESAVVADYLFLGLNKALKSKLKVLHQFPIALDGLLLLPPDSDQASRTRIVNSLKDFKPHRSSLLMGFEKVTKEELSKWFKDMNGYVKSVHRYMEQNHFSKE